MNVKKSFVVLVKEYQYMEIVMNAKNILTFPKMLKAANLILVYSTNTQILRANVKPVENTR